MQCFAVLWLLYSCVVILDMTSSTPERFRRSGFGVWHLDFNGVCVPIHVNLSKTKFTTNSNSYRPNFLNLDFLPYGNTSAHHVFQVVKQLTLPYQCTFHWSKCLPFMRSKWELIELTCIINSIGLAQKQNNVNTIGCKPQLVC